MTATISDRLEALGIELPDAAAPAANYLPFVACGGLVYTSGQLPLRTESWCMPVSSAAT